MHSPGAERGEVAGRHGCFGLGGEGKMCGGGGDRDGCHLSCRGDDLGLVVVLMLVILVRYQ